MLSLLGLNGISTGDLLVIFGMLVIVGAINGWIADQIMGQMGFGIIGNAILTFTGSVTGIIFWNMNMGSLRIQDASISIGVASASALIILLLVALFKRAVLR